MTGTLTPQSIGKIVRVPGETARGVIAQVEFADGALVEYAVDMLDTRGQPTGQRVVIRDGEVIRRDIGVYGGPGSFGWTGGGV